MVELLRIHRDAKGTTRWLEPVCERIRNMSARFDANPQGLVDEVHKRFASKDPALGLFVGIENDEIVGHVLAIIEQYDGRWVAWIKQGEHDGRAGRAVIDAVLACLTEWVEVVNLAFKDHGIHVVDLLFSTPRMTDAWLAHSGFLPFRYLMQRKIPMRSR